MTSNSSLINLEINKVKPSFDKSRFALVTSFISINKSMFTIKSEKSLDDEYTPGTFEVKSLFQFYLLVVLFYSIFLPT